jgi:glutaredoxin 3
MNAEIYTKSDCKFCYKAKDLLKKKQVEYKEFIISPGFGEKEPLSNQQYVSKEDLLDKLPNARSIPQIWLDGNYIGGYTELFEFFKG